MPLRAIFYDTETTGIKPDKDRIIEIAAFDPLENRQFIQLINPGCPIPPEASAIHHISDEMVAQAADFATVGQQFIEFCQGDVVLIAHNNDNFDLPFIKCEFARHKLPFPSEWKFLDSLKWARRYRPDLPRHSLQFLREMYGIAANNAHRALDDVIILENLFQRMTDDLSIDQVFSLLTEPRTRSTSANGVESMPFGKHQGLPLAQVPKHYVRWLAQSGALDKAENNELKISFEKLGALQA